MSNVGRSRWLTQVKFCGLSAVALGLWGWAGWNHPAQSADEAAKNVAPVAVPNSEAKSPSEMKKYTETIFGTDITFDMLPIPGGEYVMGSPDSEAGRKEDEGPQHKMKIAPFWMGKCEVSWDEYEIFNFSLDVKRRTVLNKPTTDREKIADAITKPTKPYTDMTFGKGKDGNPAICMTGLAAKTYCEWLSAKTGRFYRLPTEAEWEYACRAGTTTAYSWGDDPGQIDAYAWYGENSDGKPQKIGKKKPNPWGLHDMHGNVCEWCIDQYYADAYKKHSPDNMFFLTTKEYPQVVRGGSWESSPAECRSASRDHSIPDWKQQDPQLPKSRWYHTDALFVGFRVVRPLSGEDIKLPPTEPNKDR
jgi:formylglycine-generating enzyme required for sulfatase activity